MYVFTPKRGSPITKHASAGALIHQQQTIHGIFTQIKLSSICRNKPIVTHWAWKKRQALLTIWAKLKLANIFQFYFSVAKTLPNPRRRVPRGGKLSSSEALLYPNISN